MTQKIFIDCGFHHGEGLRQFVKMLGINKTWGVYAFEPNPECFIEERLKAIETEFKLNTVCSNAAVWIEYKRITFALENHYISDSGSPTDGKSMRDGWCSQIRNLNSNCKGLDTLIEVQAIDFSQFLLYINSEMNEDHFKPPFEIYIKMDIEGAEFKVLRKMLADGTMKLVKEIWIEFHERFIPDENPQTVAALMQEINKHTKAHLWH